MSDFDYDKKITPADLPGATPVPEFSSEAEELQYWFDLTGAGVTDNTLLPPAHGLKAWLIWLSTTKTPVKPCPYQRSF